MNYLSFIGQTLTRCYSVSRGLTVAVLAVLVLSAGLSTLVPVLLGQGISYALDRGTGQGFLTLAALFCLLWFLASAIKYLVYPLYGKLEQKAQSRVAVEALATSYAANKASRSEQDNSEVAFAIDSQMAVFRDVLSTLAMSLIPAATVLFTGSISLWLVGGWQTAVLYLLGLVGFILASTPLVRQHQQAQGNFFSSCMQNFGTLSSAVSYWKEVAVFHLSAHISKRYANSRIQVEEKGIHSYRVTRKLYLFQSGFLTLLLLGILATYLLVNQGLEPYTLAGGFIALAGVCQYSIQAVQNVGFDFSTLATSYAQQEESQGKIGARETGRQETGHSALDFTPLAGAKRGLVWIRGESGAGKTRSIEALLGFNRLTPTGGFDRQNFTDLRYLPQESNLTFETATEIIRAGRENLATQDIADLLTTLQLADFAPGGPRADALLGERGSVSGGEARRLVLARTLLGPSGALLVLDEPTTGMGAGHRPAAWQLIRQAGKENLVLVITHDTDAPVQEGDILLQVDAGKGPDGTG